MGLKIFDQFTYLHFAVGIIAYFWNIELKYFFCIHTVFELSIDIDTKEEKLAHKERTDSCAVPAASIIAESMLCIVLADSLLEKFGGDNVEELKNHINSSND